MLYLIIFIFKVLENCGLLNNIVSKLLPFHVSVPVNIDLVEEVGKIADQSFLTVRQLDLPKLEVFTCNSNKLWEIQFVVLELKLFLEHTDSDLIKVKCHICDHLFVLFLYLLVAGSWRVDRVDV